MIYPAIAVAVLSAIIYFGYKFLRTMSFNDMMRGFIQIIPMILAIMIAVTLLVFSVIIF